MSNAKKRRHFTGQEKVAILRRRLVERVAVSDPCEEHGTGEEISPIGAAQASDRSRPRAGASMSLSLSRAGCFRRTDVQASIRAHPGSVKRTNPEAHEIIARQAHS